MIFEIPDVNEKNLKFSEKIRESRLIKYSVEYRKVRDEINKLMEEDPEMKYLFKTTKGVFDGRIGVDKEFILQHLYMPKNVGSPKRGMLVPEQKLYEKYKNDKALTPILPDAPPTPDKKKFDHLYFVYMIGYLKHTKKDDKTESSLKEDDTNPYKKYEGDLFTLKYFIPKHLKIGGNVLFLPNYYNAYEGLCFPFVLKLFFKRVIIHYTGHLVALEYNGNILNKEGYPYFTPKIIEDYVEFAENMTKRTIKLNKSLLIPDKKEFFKMYQTSHIESKNFLQIPLTKLDTEYILFSLQELQKNPYDYKTYIKAAVGKEEGKYLFNLVSEKRLKNIAEVGFANGISAAYILIALQEINGHLISIDPFQTTQWKDAGSKLIKDMKQTKRHTLIQKKSHVALPELLEKYGEESFDMIFIDGWHTFDYTLVDAYYADKLVKKGGYIVIDDALHPGVNACVKYMDTNWKHLKHITSAPKTFAAYFKQDDDKRDWFFHHVF